MWIVMSIVKMMMKHVMQCESAMVRIVISIEKMMTYNVMELIIMVTTKFLIVV